MDVFYFDLIFFHATSYLKTRRHSFTDYKAISISKDSINLYCESSRVGGLKCQRMPKKRPSDTQLRY